MAAKTVPLSQYFRKKERVFSFELSSKREVNFALLGQMKFGFCSVIWIGMYDKEVSQIEPLMLSKQLIDLGYNVMLHLPARNVSKNSIKKILDYCKQIGIRNFLVMRGASPETKNTAETYDFPYALDLIKYIKSHYQDFFEIAVTGYPHIHPESAGEEDDMLHLKLKVEAGAQYIVTQASLSYEPYLSFLTCCKKYGVNAKIIPGVYIMRSSADFALLSKLCKVPADESIRKFVKNNKHNEEAIAKFGTETCLAILKKLLYNNDFLPPHIFTMNELESLRLFLMNFNY